MILTSLKNWETLLMTLKMITEYFSRQTQSWWISLKI